MSLIHANTTLHVLATLVIKSINERIHKRIENNTLLIQPGVYNVKLEIASNNPNHDNATNGMNHLTSNEDLMEMVKLDRNESFRIGM